MDKAVGTLQKIWCFLQHLRPAGLHPHSEQICSVLYLPSLSWCLIPSFQAPFPASSDQCSMFSLWVALISDFAMVPSSGFSLTPQPATHIAPHTSSVSQILDQVIGPRTPMQEGNLDISWLRSLQKSLWLWRNPPWRRIQDEIYQRLAKIQSLQPFNLPL